MLDFVIFAVTFLVALLIALIYLYPGGSKPSTIPGLDPTTKEDGNLTDITRAGSLHEFLMDLHKQFGPIASFWMGRTYVVSIASPELFKEHQGIFDRPPELFQLFEPLIGPKSIQYANKTDGRARRNRYDKVLSHGHMKHYFSQFQELNMLCGYTEHCRLSMATHYLPLKAFVNTTKEVTQVADEMEKKWSSLVKEEHVPLSQYMSAFALKVVLQTLFGQTFKGDKEILEFRRCYDVCWAEMEHRLTDIPDPKSPRQKAFDEALCEAKKFIRQAIQHHKEKPSNPGEELLIDVLLEHTADEETVLSDAISYAVGGFHTTGNLLTWCFYFLATHLDVQEKVCREIKEKLGKEDVDHTNIDDLPYARQVLDETLRCCVLAPWAARFQDFDTELGGHKLPKNTPVIHALGVSLQDEKYWPLPNKFDPDRFLPANVKSRPTMAFQPYGFAGKRICPGYRFAYGDSTVCLVTLIRKFKVTLVEGQVVNPVHGLVTHPEEEIWIKIEKR